MSIFECRQKWKKFQLTTHPKFGSPLFKVLMETEHLHRHYEKVGKDLQVSMKKQSIGSVFNVQAF